MPPPSYHHGDLPDALRKAATSVIDDKGLAGFSLREVARRAGVSHSAPAHHFGDSAGLLTSMAIEALTQLRHATAEASESKVAVGVTAQLSAIGRAYLEVGGANPSYWLILSREDLIRTDDPDYLAAGAGCISVLELALANAVPESIDEPDRSERLGVAVMLAWTSIHGLLSLFPNDRAWEENVATQQRPDTKADLIDAFAGVIVASLETTTS